MGNGIRKDQEHSAPDAPVSIHNKNILTDKNNTSVLPILPEDILRYHILHYYPFDFLAVSKKFRDEAKPRIFYDPRFNDNMVEIGIQYAAKYGDLVLLKKFMSFPDAISITYDFNRPLRLATQSGHLEIIKYIMEFPDADPKQGKRTYYSKRNSERFDCPRRCTICIAYMSGHKHIIEYFKSFGEKFAGKLVSSAIRENDLKSLAEIIADPTKYGVSWKENAGIYLSKAITKKNEEAVSLLLKNISQVLLPDGLRAALWNKENWWAVKPIVSIMEKITDQTAASLMSALSRDEIIDLLKQCARPPNCILLCGAIRKGDIELVAYFLKHPGWTPNCLYGISIALQTKKDNIEMLDLLISHGIGDQYDIYKALQCGIASNTITKQETAQKLLAGKTDVSKDWYESLLQLAIYEKNEAVALALLNHSFVQQVTKSDLMTYLKWTEKLNLPNVVKCITSKIL